MDIVYKNKLKKVSKSVFDNFIKELHLHGELNIGDCYQFLSPEQNVIAVADVLDNKYYIWNGEKERVDLDADRVLAQKFVETIKEMLDKWQQQVH